MITIENNPFLTGLSVFVPKVVYSRAGGAEISMDLLLPQTVAQDMRCFPVILFVQGSAWHCPDTNYEILQLAQFAAAGYVVATIRHRNISDGYPAPAFLQDAKTAIRFLRANRADYHIDPERVYAFGTSSGGNTVLLLGLTGDDPAYKTEEYSQESDAVSGVIDCFGPTDLLEMLDSSVKNGSHGAEENQLLTEFCGGAPDRELLRRMSPYYCAEEGREYVPFLIAHGNQDPVVAFSQSEKMVQRLQACGAQTEFICVNGAEHEGTFWSQKLLNLFMEFLNKQSGTDGK